ncbi:hypothetical protein SteCoe_16910 [Stentor coeruleus]|uniref:Uncharacterized protein n=1 Tax=Stentor coeruleus TaxID=5963 RepID=A0A1R2C083_9CILI|nr:hypothetical protein SteCoe_16910 [Stentor coeruleus]
MKSSKDLLREIEYELSNPRNKSPIRDTRVSRNTEILKSEILADKILEKIRSDKEKFLIDCRKIKTQILQMLGDDGKKPF